MAAGGGAVAGGAGALVGIGAAAGAAGSLASQGVGIAMGLQDKINWKGVAMSAIAGGVGAGVGQALPMDKLAGSAFLANAARGAAGSLVTQGIAVATGLQNKFDWAGVAAAGIGSGVAGSLSRSAEMDGKFVQHAGSHLRQGASSMAGAIANGAVRSLLDGSSFGDNVLAAIPDVIGSTLGNMLADGLSRPLHSDAGAATSRGAPLGSAASSLTAATSPGAGADDISQMPADAADIVVTAQRSRVQLRDLMLQLSLDRRASARAALVTSGVPYSHSGSPSGQMRGHGDIADGPWNPKDTLAGAINDYAYFMNGTDDDLAGWLLHPENKYLERSDQGVADLIERLDWESDGNDLMIAGNISALYSTGNPLLVRVAQGLEEVAAERWLDGGMQATAHADDQIATLIRSVNPLVDNLLFARDVISGEASRNEMMVRGGAAALPALGGIASRVVGHAETRIARASRLGREGEAIIGLTGRRGIIMGGRMRFPDGVDDVGRVLSEVKNVKYQGWTRQLQDYSAWAKDNGYSFVLHLRPTTRPSRHLEAAIRRGDVRLGRPIQ